jgi:hypothetical protein
MKKGLKIAVITVAALVVVAVGVFVVVPQASSKATENKLREAFSSAGIPDDMWDMDKAYYEPLSGNVVVENLRFGEKGEDNSITAKKVILRLKGASKDNFAGSIDAQGVSLKADNDSASAQSFGVHDFSVDTTLFQSAPVKAVKKLGSIQLGNVMIQQKGKAPYSVEKLNVVLNYSEGNIPRSSSISINGLALNMRDFLPQSSPLSNISLSTVALTNSVSGNVDTVNLTIDGNNLCSIKTAMSLTVPQEILQADDITKLENIDYNNEIKLNSFSFNYTDKSLLDDIFKLAGMTGSKEEIADQLNQNLSSLASIAGVDGQRFAREASNYIVNPGKLELKTNFASPVSLEDIIQNPLSLKLQLSINGGKPFTTAGE